MSAIVVVRKNKVATEAIKKGEGKEDALHKYSTFSLRAGLIRTGTKLGGPTGFYPNFKNLLCCF